MIMIPSHRNWAHMAGKIHARLMQQAEAEHAALDGRLTHLCDQVATIQHLRSRLNHCRQHRWTAAARRVLQELDRHLIDLGVEQADLQRMIRAAQARTAPTLRLVYDELLQLEQEFGDVGYDRQAPSLSVVTEPITLEGIALGRFEIRLELNGLDGPVVPERYLRIVALEPNPAGGHAAVTHPHVSDERLCPGEATMLLRSALTAGRLCDLFLVVQSVLTTYNEDSPFVPLDHWEGQACTECECTIGREDGCWCEACERDFCEACVDACPGCRTTLCQGCMVQCAACTEAHCESCLRNCVKCQAACCAKCLGDTRLCPACRETPHHEDQDETHDLRQDKVTAPANPGSRPAPEVAVCG